MFLTQGNVSLGEKKRPGQRNYLNISLCMFFGKVVVYKHGCLGLNMLHLEKLVLTCCVVCGMTAVYYLPLYVLVCFIVAVLVYLYYENQVNFSSAHVRVDTRSHPLRKLLLYLRLQIESNYTAIMKNYRQFKQVSNRSNTNGMGGMYICQENNSSVTDTSQRGYTNIGNHYTSVVRDSVDCSEQRRSLSPYNLKSNDSFSRMEHSRYLSPKRNPRLLNDSVSPQGSPWGTTVSPKLRSPGVGTKTVQTVAGPLLASTRYNININSGLVI